MKRYRLIFPTGKIEYVYGEKLVIGTNRSAIWGKADQGYDEPICVIPDSVYVQYYPELVVKTSDQYPIGIIAKTKNRCREMAKERNLKPVIEGVGDCVLITSIADMCSCTFSEFISDDGIKFDSDWQMAMLNSLVTNTDK